MNDSFTRVNGSGKIPVAIRELQSDARATRPGDHVNVLQDRTTRGVILHARGSGTGTTSTQQTSTWVPRWG